MRLEQHKSMTSAIDITESALRNLLMAERTGCHIRYILVVCDNNRLFGIVSTLNPPNILL
jgi:hypothetical protein